MKCFFCDTEVRWNNDFESEDMIQIQNNNYAIMNVIIVRLGMKYLLIKRKLNDKYGYV